MDSPEAPSQIDPGWYVTLVESAPDATVLIDSDGSILLVNAQTERLFGYPRAELLGQPIEILIPERYRRGHGVHRDAYFGEPKVREMGAGIELWGQRKDGTEFPVEISLSPLRTATGTLATASIRDATARRKAQEKFRTLLESAPDAMVIIDKDGRIVLVNAQAERMFGYQREALIGRSVEILVPEKLRGTHIGHRSEYFRAPKVRAMGAGVELRGRRKDGTEFPIEISLSPMETEEGRWATAAVRDISEWRGIQQARNLLASIVESSGDAIITKDLKGLVTSWNHGAERLFGYSAAEIVGKPISVLFPPGHEDEETAILARIRSAEERQHFETMRRRKDGSDIAVSVTISPVMDITGQVIGASKIVRDITDRKRAEDKFRALLETAPDAMVIIDDKGQIQLVNAQTERLFGYHRTELAGQAVEVLIPERYRGRHSGIRLGYFKDPNVRPMGAGLELWGRRKDGTEFPVEISLSPLKTEGATWATAAVRDATERKRAAERLERSNRDLEQFAYVASHDLQAPLRSVVGFAQLLQKKYRDKIEKKADEYLDHIVKSSSHMQALILGLLEFSRVGRQDTELVPVDSEKALELALTQLRALIDDRKAKVTRGHMPQVYGVEVELAQLFQNLIGNAIKFQKPGVNPEVHIEARRDGTYWIFSVLDHGIGMKAENFTKLFKMFQRLHTRDEYEGTGIGLAICQKIVHRHGGRIWVQSELGSGSTFFFTLLAV